MANKVVKFFQAQFHEDTVPNNFGIIDHVPHMLNDDHNQDLVRQPTREEVRHEVFVLS